MNQRLFGWLATAALLWAQPAFAYTQAELDAQLALLMEWWSGEFDNNEQIVRQSGGGLSQPVFEPHFRVHSHFQPIKLEALGEHVFYVEEYKNNNPNDLYRIRLMSLHTDLEANGIRIHMYSPKDEQGLAGSHRDLEQITTGPVEQWQPHNAGCTVFLAYEGGQFRGGMQQRACIGVDPEGDEKDVWFDYHIVVGPGFYWFKDAVRKSENDELVMALAPGSPDYFQADRARWFQCVVNYNADGDMTAPQRLTEVSLHDQGGSAGIDYPGERQLSLVLHNRAFSTPTKNRFRILRLHEDNPTVPLAYGYAGADTDRFGINLGWFYTLCRPAGESVGG
jgi:hypothetical protein